MKPMIARSTMYPITPLSVKTLTMVLIIENATFTRAPRVLSRRPDTADTSAELTTLPVRTADIAERDRSKRREDRRASTSPLPLVGGSS